MPDILVKTDGYKKSRDIWGVLKINCLLVQTNGWLHLYNNSIYNICQSYFGNFSDFMGYMIVKILFLWYDISLTDYICLFYCRKIFVLSFIVKMISFILGTY